jgi:hypothetical protein
MIRWSIFVLVSMAFVAAIGCQSETPSTAPKNPSQVMKTEEHGDDHHEGPSTELGSATVGGWTVRATREETAITAGGSAPVDFWITGGTGKVTAARCWIGVADAAGSVKALAEVEDASDQTHRHTHVEVPNPIPAGSKLWLEVEDDSGAKNVASFDLKM